MRSKYTLATLVISIVMIIAAAAPCRADDYGTLLFEMLKKQLSPESMTMQLMAQPEENGYIPWGYLEATNAKVRGMNITELKVDCFEAHITPPSEWEGMSYPKVKSMAYCRVFGRFTEKDVNEYLKNRLFGHEKEWRNISVRMQDGRIVASGYYIARLPIFTLKIRVDISCIITGHGTGLYLEDIDLRLNTRKVAKSLVRRAIQKLQPFIDMKKYNLPISIQNIDFKDGECVVSSMMLPKPISSELKWEFKK